MSDARDEAARRPFGRVRGERTEVTDPVDRGTKSEEKALARPTILMCEPQWAGRMHATFNAALLESARVAFPGWAVAFAADRTHVGAVREALPPGSPLHEHLRTLEIPVAQAPGWSRRLQADPIWQLRRLVPALRPRIVILASVTAVQVAIAKLAFGTLRPGTRLLAFLHENAIEALEGDARAGALDPGKLRARWNRSSWPRDMVLAVFGDRVLREVRQCLPEGTGERIVSIRPPCLPDPLPTEEELRARWSARQIALVGNTYKGRLEEFLHVARAVRERSPDVRFVLAGGLRDSSSPLAREARCLFGDGADAEMLPREVFRRIVRGATFGVVHLEPSAYRARVSAGTLDTFAACLPSAIRSIPFNDSCVETEALPAVLYRNVSGLEDALNGFLERTTFEEYRRTVEGIAKGRQVFSPEAVGVELRSVLSRSFEDRD